MRLFGVIVVLGCASTLWAACSDSGGTGSSAVNLTGTVTEVVPGSLVGGQPIADVEVCEVVTNICDLTDENGTYAIRVFKANELSISFVRDGFGPTLVGVRSGVVDFTLDAGMATDEVLTDFFDALGAAYPPQASGYLTATTFRDDTPLAGVSYSISRSSGTSFYFDDQGVPDTSLLETQASGSGGFTDVTPAEVEVTVSGAANCVATNSWAAAASNSFRLPIRVGFWTQTRVDCE